MENKVNKTKLIVFTILTILLTYVFLDFVIKVEKSVLIIGAIMLIIMFVTVFILHKLKINKRK
ncbi:hypothetical protein METP1_00046 [Methanosarcinales archaeon]|nr:hypothetical protein METP1_00046 [Methanosarcinales archaeon]